MVFRLVQFLDFFFLPLGEGVFLLVHFVQKHEQHAGEQSHHNHGKRGIKQSVMLAVRRSKGGKVKGRTVTKQGFRSTQPKECSSTPSLQRDTDINKAEDKPLRHTAVEAAGGKKGNGKQDKQQNRNQRGTCVDALCPNAVLGDHRHGNKTGHQYQNVPNTPSHRQSKGNCDHADARHDAEHAFPQADSVIRDDCKPFFNHAVPHPLEYGIFKRKAQGAYFRNTRAELVIGL